MKNQTAMDRNFKARTINLIEKIGDFWTLGIFFLIVLVFTLIEPKFFSVPYWSSTLVYLSEVLLLGVAETFVIITAGIDLSVGAIEGFIGIVTALLIKALVPVVGPVGAIILGILIGLFVGAIIGYINGKVVTKMHITPFIATLGMMGILTGLTFILANGTDIVGLPLEMGKIGNIMICNIFGLATIVSWSIAIIGYIMLSKTRFGIYTYAIGSNAEASRRSGINVDRHLVKVYMFSAVTSAVAGILMILRFNTASPLTGSNINMSAVAAVVIGGTSLMGGTGNIFGSVIGAAIISILITGLVMINVQPFWQTVAIGVIIILAVYIDQLRHKNEQAS